MTLTAEPTTSALTALKAGQCAPSCLLGTETGRCGCRCQGAHHGALLTALTGPAETTTPTAETSRTAKRRQRKERRKETR
jgi:hypothetical protein